MASIGVVIGVVLTIILALIFLTKQTPSPNLVEQSNSWNCTVDKMVEGTAGQPLTLVTFVDPVDRCYFVFTHQHDNHQCCYDRKHDNFCGALSYKNGPECLKRDDFSVKIDSKGRSAVDTCNITIKSDVMSSTSFGKWQSFNGDSQAKQKFHIITEKDYPSYKLEF